MDRFWSKVDMRGPDECWQWKAATCHGYGQIRLNGHTRYAHRVSWELANGPIPDGDGYHGTCVCHRCDNPLCVNPTHIFLGSNEDNQADMTRKGRRPRGSKIGNSKLIESVVADMRDRYARGVNTRSQLAKEYGVSLTTVCDIIKGKWWRQTGKQGQP